MVKALAPGLWRWLCPHPDWKPGKGGPGGWEREVASFCHRPKAGPLIIVDPLLPAPGRSRRRLISWLKGLMAQAGGKALIVTMNSFHRRGACALRSALGRRRASICAHRAAANVLGFKADRLLNGPAELAGGVRALAVDGYYREELVLWLEGPRALVFADTLIGVGGGKVRVAPASWAPQGAAARLRYDRLFRRSLARLLRLPARALIPSHGEPVLSGGRKALRQALEATAWGG